MKLTLHGLIPSKKNSKIIVCRGRFPLVLPSAAYKKWHKEQSSYLKQLQLPYMPSTTSIVITIFAPDKRKADLTNKVESVMDLLVDNGVLADDNWFVCPHVDLRFGGVDKYTPRAEVEII